MPLIRYLAIATSLVSVIPLLAVAQPAGGITSVQVQKFFRKSAKNGALRPGEMIGDTKIVSTIVSGNQVTIRLAAPASMSAAALEEAALAWPTGIGKLCNDTSTRAYIENNNIAFVISLETSEARTLATLLLNSSTCPNLRERITKEATVTSASTAANKQLSKLHDETEIYKRLVALENSPQGQMCKGYVGQTIALTSFDTAVARYAKLGAKGEFETTAQYDGRRRVALGAAGIKPLVIGVPVDRDYLEYDADKQELTIEPFAFGEAGIAASAGSSLAAWLALDNAGLKASVISSTNVAIEVDSNDLTTGSYTSGNALGATVRVTKITRTSRTIFDRESDTVSSAQAKWRLFPIAELEPHAVDSLKVIPSQAKALKNSLRLAFLVQPKEPFLISASTTETPAATFQRPREMKEVSKILVADIQCGLALNAAGKVLGAYPTN